MRNKVPAETELFRFDDLQHESGVQKKDSRGDPDASLGARVVNSQKSERGNVTTSDGRPTQVFIGYLPAVSKHDAVEYAVGVAERNATRIANAAYHIEAWKEGWVYEVHEGGSKRSFLPSILGFFDSKDTESALEELVAFIITARRVVRVERTPSGLLALQMPESFVCPQSSWLELGPKLTPAITRRSWVLMAGIALFGSGSLSAFLAMNQHLSPVQSAAASRNTIAFEELPLSQWTALLTAASDGYVTSLEYSTGHWQIHRSPASGIKPVDPPGVVGPRPGN